QVLVVGCSFRQPDHRRRADVKRATSVQHEMIVGGNKCECEEACGTIAARVELRVLPPLEALLELTARKCAPIEQEGLGGPKGPERRLIDSCLGLAIVSAQGEVRAVGLPVPDVRTSEDGAHKAILNCSPPHCRTAQHVSVVLSGNGHEPYVGRNLA